jgi:hypothetical protein
MKDHRADYKGLRGFLSTARLFTCGCRKKLFNKKWVNPDKYG